MGQKNGHPRLIPLKIENNMVNEMLVAIDKGFGLSMRALPWKLKINTQERILQGQRLEKIGLRA